MTLACPDRHANEHHTTNIMVSVLAARKKWSKITLLPWPYAQHSRHFLHINLSTGSQVFLKCVESVPLCFPWLSCMPASL